jgi:hypothetical protein
MLRNQLKQPLSRRPMLVTSRRNLSPLRLHRRNRSIQPRKTLAGRLRARRRNV